MNKGKESYVVHARFKNPTHVDILLFQIKNHPLQYHLRLCATDRCLRGISWAYMCAQHNVPRCPTQVGVMFKIQRCVLRDATTHVYIVDSKKCKAIDSEVGDWANFIEKEGFLYGSSHGSYCASLSGSLAGLIRFARGQLSESKMKYEHAVVSPIAESTSSSNYDAHLHERIIIKFENHDMARISWLGWASELGDVEIELTSKMGFDTTGKRYMGVRVLFSNFQSDSFGASRAVPHEICTHTDWERGFLRGELTTQFGFEIHHNGRCTIIDPNGEIGTQVGSVEKSKKED